jgi:hypothetical protein
MSSRASYYSALRKSRQGYDLTPIFLCNTMRFNRPLIAITLCTVLMPCTSRAVDWLDVSGYLKSFAVGIHPAEIENASDEFQQDFMCAMNNRARANIAVYFSEWLDFNLSYDLSLRIQDDDLFRATPLLVFQVLSIYRVDDLNLLIWPDEPGEGDYVAFFQNLDRFYLTLRAPRFDLFVGRQVIAWGSAHAINPTDIIAPFLYTEIDAEDRIGVDAARLRVPAGSLGEVDVGYVAGEDFKWTESAVFARGKFYAGKTDFALLGIAFRENAMAGIDVTRAVGGAGVWCEAAYVWAKVLDDRSSVGTDNDYFRLSTGADYNFGAGVYTFLEYHYNGAGVNDPTRYLWNIASNPTAYQDGAVYFFGRHYIIPGVSWQVTPLTVLFVEVLANVSDGSFLLAPNVEYNAAENIYLSIGAYGAIGKNPEMATVGHLEQLQFNSEFGAYSSRYYAFLRYYF